MLRFLTAGESHGKALTVIVEGIVAGLPLTEDYIAQDLKRRQGGYGRSERMQIEQDRAEILSGVRHGLTMGSPIALLISNRVWGEWERVMSVLPVKGEVEPLTQPRPGHADLAGVLKYGLKDVRPILERASARETAARVAAGAVARKLLEEFGVQVHSHTLAIGGQWAREKKRIDWKQVESSPVRCADSTAEKAMIAAIDEAKATGDTVGGVCEVVALGVPPGLGSHTHWDRRLDGRIAQAIMSIPSVKGVEIGGGCALADMKGSQVQDVIEPSKRGARFWQRTSNRAGGIEGGISNGEPLVVRAAIKPISTMAKPLSSMDLSTGQVVPAHYERSDICIVPAAGVIAEAMLAWVLAVPMLEKFGGDSLEEMKRNYKGYTKSFSQR